jgi:hypothetical protein
MVCEGGIMKKVTLFFLLVATVYATGPSLSLFPLGKNETSCPAPVIDVQGNWTAFSQPGLNADRLIHGTVYDPMDDKIYMIGGTPNGYATTLRREIYEYDPQTDTWNTSLSLMNTARGWIQGAYYNGKIYVMGGMNTATQATNTCEVYDINTDSWSYITSLPQSRCAHGTVAYNGNVYVVGGTNLYTGYNTVYRYNINSDSWSTCTSLPDAWDMGGCAILDNVIYICGGYNRNDTITWDHIYSGTINLGDPDDITWAQEAALPFPTGNCGATALDGDIYIVGGFDESYRVPSRQFLRFHITTGSLIPLVLYPIAITRCHLLIGRSTRTVSEVYGVAGDADGNWSPPNNYYYKIEDPAGIAEDADLPLKASNILSVCPSVGDQKFKISFILPSINRAIVTLHNALGQKIATLYEGRTIGKSLDLSPDGLSRGVYFIRLQTSDMNTTEKLIITD